MSSDHTPTEKAPAMHKDRAFEAPNIFYCPILWLPNQDVRTVGSEPSQVRRGKISDRQDRGPHPTVLPPDVRPPQDGPTIVNVTINQCLC